MRHSNGLLANARRRNRISQAQAARRDERIRSTVSLIIVSRSKLLLTLVAALLHFSALPIKMALAASTESERVSIKYEPPPSCPTQERFLAQVGSRISVPWLAEKTELARPIRITLEPLGREFIARMKYTDNSGQEIVRLVRAPNCEQAVAGIALVTSIAIESLSERSTAANADLEGRAKPEGS